MNGPCNDALFFLPKIKTLVHAVRARSPSSISKSMEVRSKSFLPPAVTDNLLGSFPEYISALTNRCPILWGLDTSDKYTQTSN